MTDLRKDLRLILDAAIDTWSRDTRSQDLKAAILRWEMIYEAVQSTFVEAKAARGRNIRPSSH